MSEGVACPVCGLMESRVLDVRPAHREGTLKRRRQCPNGHRYTTKEMLATEYNYVRSMSHIKRYAIVTIDFATMRVNLETTK